MKGIFLSQAMWCLGIFSWLLACEQFIQPRVGDVKHHGAHVTCPCNEISESMLVYDCPGANGEILNTVYPKKYAHVFCFAVLCCGYTLTDFPISIRLTSLALWQSNDCPSASKATLMNMDKYFMWIHYERLHNHNKAKHNKTVCIFLGIYLYHVLISHLNQ